MICCLNPDCHNPPNSDRTMFCSNCGTGIVCLRMNNPVILVAQRRWTISGWHPPDD